MTRPTYTPAPIASGMEGWDAEVTDNFDQVKEVFCDHPAPLAKYASLGALPAANLYDQCAAIVWDGSTWILVVSDGAAWNPAGSSLIPLTTKGDIVTRDGTHVVRKGVGANTKVLKADSAQADGLVWDNVAATEVTGFDTQVRTNRLDQMAAPTADVSMNTHKITGVVDPVNPQDAATKAYVDAFVLGISPKTSVRVATTAPGTLATSFENGDTVDGVVLATGNRILIKDQAAPAENGIYIVNASGAPTRAIDFDSNAEVEAGAFVFVEEGTTNADSGWVLTTDGTIVINTTGLAFVQFSGAGQITAGAGLSKTGNTLDVNVDGVTLEISSDALRVKDKGITNPKIRDSLATSVIGRSAGTDGVPADIQTTTNGQVLRRKSGALGFGAVDLSDAANAVENTLGVANGGTNRSHPPIFTTFEFYNKTALATNTSVRGYVQSTEAGSALFVPTGKTMKVVAARAFCKAGANGAGTHTVDVILRNATDNTDVVLATGTGASSAVIAIEAVGTIDAPLGTLAAGKQFLVGILNRNTSPGALDGTLNLHVQIVAIFE